MNLLSDASRQLFKRPDDEHFASMQAIMDHANDARNRSHESELDLNDSHAFFSNHNGTLRYNLPDGQVVYPNVYAMKQIGVMAGLPMRTMENIGERAGMDLLVKNLNALVKTNERNNVQKLFIERHPTNDDQHTLRAINSTKYTRLYDAEVLQKTHELLLPSGMIPALPIMNSNANRDNIMGNNKPCLFRGDQDSFAFFMEDELPNDDLGGLRIGFMVQNSEVGTLSFKWTMLYFRDICANFLIWGAQGVQQKRLIHRGNISPKWSEFQRDLIDVYAKAKERKGEDLTVFARAAERAFVGDGSPTDSNKANAAKLLTDTKPLKIGKKQAVRIVDSALLPANGGDLSVWSIAQGITWEAKDTGNASTMVDASLAANKVLAVVR